MKHKIHLFGLIALITILASGSALAQSPLSSTFTYQGYLTLSGSPVTGTCDLRFSLWNDPSGGSQIGVTDSIDGVSVSEGLFNILLNDGDEFGGSAFNGEARWLEIEVRCPAGSGSYTTLAPRVALTPVPYSIYSLNSDMLDGQHASAFWALGGNSVGADSTLGTLDNYALDFIANNSRILRLEPNATSPNIIGGYSGNAITPGVYGAFIGGGGADGALNTITDSYSVVCGGYSNQAGNNAGIVSDAQFSVVTGGFNNIASGLSSFVGGGENNHATGQNSFVGGGRYDVASAGFSTVCGGVGNTASGTGYSTIGGGYSNTSSGEGSVVGGGEFNSSSGWGDTISGGRSNNASGGSGVIGGGIFNTISWWGATIGGGLNNTASYHATTVSGGEYNLASGYISTVGGGSGNQAVHEWTTISGGQNNIASGSVATIGGGADNTASGTRSVIAGGGINTAINEYSTIGGGTENIASGFNSTIAGGGFNTAGGGSYAAICGGIENVAEGHGSSIGGGYHNSAIGNYASIVGGYDNGAFGIYTFVGGGKDNTANGGYTTIGGGYGNTADLGSFIGGGYFNIASGEYSSIAGGSGNEVSGSYATIGGGEENTASANDATISGGTNNTVSWQYATVSGGGWNTASYGYTTVCGGYSNIASGNSATACGGMLNTAAGDWSFATGRRAKNTEDHDGVFIFADSNDFDFSSTAANEFAARATGGVRFVSAIDGSGNPTAGVSLASGGGSWSSISDRALKANFAAVNSNDLLDAIASMPISTWNYKAQDQSIRHIGPTAQDFYTAFGVGEDNKHITTIDADGVALAAIQGLYQLEKENNAALEARIAALESGRPVATSSPAVNLTLPWVLFISIAMLNVGFLFGRHLSRRR
jgi:hypothetical protein